jgi:hypothetical protein
MAHITVSTAVSLAGRQIRAPAHLATMDMRARTARPQARALPPPARVRMGLTESSTASTVAPSAALLDRARAHAARDTTDRVARTKSRILAQFLPTQPRPPGATGLITASTVALSVVLTQLARQRARAHLAMRDMEAQAARQPAHALLLQIQAKMAQMGASTVSTAVLLVGVPGCARARLVTQGMKAQAVRQRARATIPQHPSLSASLLRVRAR